MKKSIFVFVLLALSSVCVAQNSGVSLDDIIDSESNAQSQKDREAHLKKIWSKRSFVNFSYNTTTLESDELPTEGGVYEDKFENDWGASFQYGNTYFFHKKALGSVVLIGLDYVAIDLSYSQFKAQDPNPLFSIGSGEPYSMPWHQKKSTIDYGMTLGPSLTLFPFAPLGKKGTDKIRLHLYYHIGYGAGVALVNDVQKGLVGRKENKWLWSHGMSQGFGFNLTWDGIGVGYEAMRASKLKYKSFDDEFGSDEMEMERKMNRVYLQIRF